MKIKLKINNHEDRINMVSSLAQNGYKTWIEEEKISGIANYDYYVCFNLKDKKEYTGARIE